MIRYRYEFFYNLFFSDKVALKVALAMLGKFCITASYAIIYLMAAEVFPTVVRWDLLYCLEMTGTTSGIWTTHPSGAPKFISGI